MRQERKVVSTALLKQLGGISINRDEIVVAAVRMFLENAAIIQPPRWAEERDERRWKVLVRAKNPREWNALLEGFTRRDKRWVAIVDLLRPRLERAASLPSLKHSDLLECYAEEQHWLLPWLREEQQRFFLQCCWKAFEVGLCPDLGWKALSSLHMEGGFR